MNEYGELYVRTYKNEENVIKIIKTTYVRTKERRNGDKEDEMDDNRDKYVRTYKKKENEIKMNKTTYVRTKEKKDRKVGRRDERTYVRNFRMGKS